MVLPSKCATKKRMLVYLADLVVNFSWFLAKLNLGNTRFVSWFCFEKCATLRLLVSVKVHSYCYSNRFLGKELTIWKIGRVWKYTRQNYKTCIFQLQHWEKGEKKGLGTKLFSPILMAEILKKILLTSIVAPFLILRDLGQRNQVVTQQSSWPGSVAKLWGFDQARLELAQLQPRLLLTKKKGWMAITL